MVRGARRAIAVGVAVAVACGLQKHLNFVPGPGFQSFQGLKLAGGLQENAIVPVHFLGKGIGSIPKFLCSIADLISKSRLEFKEEPSSCWLLLRPLEQHAEAQAQNSSASADRMQQPPQLLQQ